MRFTAKDIRLQTQKLRDLGLSNDEIQQQLKAKGFDPYEPPVSQRIDPSRYAEWRRASIQSGAQPSSDRPMIDQMKNYENLKNIDTLDSSYSINNKTNLQNRIAANELKFSDINKGATENLYQTNPEYLGQFGRAQIGQLAELPIYYAASKAAEVPEASAVELPPDVQAQKEAFNRAYIQSRMKKQ